MTLDFDQDILHSLNQGNYSRTLFIGNDLLKFNDTALISWVVKAQRNITVFQTFISRGL